MKLLFLLVLAMSLGQQAAVADEPGCAVANPSAAIITIDEFADFECGYCAKGSHVMQKILKDYPNVRLVFHNLPLHEKASATTAAKAFTAICLQDPAKAFAYQHELFDNQDQLVAEGEPFLLAAAEKVGADVARMRADMASPAVAQRLADDLSLAAQHQFKGTPSFLVGGDPLVGAWSYETFKKLIDEQVN